MFASCLKIGKLIFRQLLHLCASMNFDEIAIPTILALKLQQNGKQVDFAAPWGQGHSGDYDLEALLVVS